MNAELFIHGPRHAFYGKQDEVSYSALFDDSSIKDEIRFIVEIRKSTDNKWYTYYHYCRYSNVSDIDGRNGAYMGISLRLDAYYTNLRVVYTILDAMFYKGVVGLLLQRVPSGFQYVVNNFEGNRTQILDKIEKPFGVALTQIISSQDTVSIDSSFKTGGKAYVHGIDDTQFKERCLTEMRAVGKIIFASSIPIEQLQVVMDQCNRDKQAFVDSKKQEISRLESDLSSSENEIKTLTEKLRNRESECKSLSDEISRLKQEIAAFKVERGQLNSLKDTNKHLENQLRTSENNVAKLNRDLSSFEAARKQLNSLKDTNKHLENQLRAARKEIEQLHQVGVKSDDETSVTTSQKKYGSIFEQHKTHFFIASLICVFVCLLALFFILMFLLVKYIVK